MITSGPYPKENESLDMHVNICAERYKQLDSRLGIVEQEIKEISTTIKTSNTSLRNTVITTAGTIMASIIALVSIILNT